MICHDGRRRSSRRYKTLTQEFSADLGGDASLSNAERALVAQAAVLALRAEELRGAILRGDTIDDDQLVRCSNSFTRILMALGQRRKSKEPPSQSLEEYLAQTNDETGK